MFKSRNTTALVGLVAYLLLIAAGPALKLAGVLYCNWWWTTVLLWGPPVLLVIWLVLLVLWLLVRPKKSFPLTPNQQ